MLEILQFDFEQIDDWLGWLWLPQVVQHLEQQEQSLDLQEGFNMLEILEQLVDVAHANPVLLDLVSHCSAVVKQHSVQI